MSKIQGICATPACANKQVVTTYNYLGTGQAYYRKWCQHCHETRTASRHGLKSIAQVVAKNAGYSSVNAYRNSIHPFRKHRKERCQNKDGRLGFKCKYKIRHSAQLQVDHIDGNPTNNRKKNLQTLCANCHIYKTHMYKDYATPGRKALKYAAKKVSHVPVSQWKHLKIKSLSFAKRKVDKKK